MSNDTEREEQEHVIHEKASWEEALKRLGDDCEDAGGSGQETVTERKDSSVGGGAPGETNDRAGDEEPGVSEEPGDAAPEDDGQAERAVDGDDERLAEHGDTAKQAGDKKATVQKRTKKNHKELLDISDDPQVELEQVRKELENIKQELAIKEDKLIRMVAEFENYKKRTRREWELHQKRANAQLIKDILGILDDFERAFEAPEDSGDHFRSGVQLIYYGLLDVLGRAGLSEVDAEKQPFDPQYHEALGETESDEVEDGCVANVVQKGYILRDQLLRPAKVIVAKTKESQN